ncbi:NAD(P)-dependent alcohol dehydrogenase [Rouxiella sp. T17]|uniref:NAD(P)-dependent alcohol dehydrogenase n=1 Tax=Rouxiella sp. T17 TaxID=3085684 RepID=UPI002FC63B2B
MTLNVRGFAAQSAETELAPHNFVRRDPRDTDVVIDIKYCGVCHSDIHQARNEWHQSVYPLVPGHEIIGYVTHVGAKVTQFKVGDAVGVGCMVDSCQECSTCKADLEQYCEAGPTMTYNSLDRHDGMMTYGGYSEQIVVAEKFVLRVPEALDFKAAAPLLCAGITTYSPLKHWGVKPGDKVAIVGLGGLGHMGLKFAHAMGADVTLFTRSAGKEQEARRLGANHVVLSTDEKQMADVKNHFDFILDTVPHQHDLNPYLDTLKVNGVHILVGLIEPVEPAVHAGKLIGGRKSLVGSLIGGIAETQEMLDFCAENNIGCDVEMINMDQINEAYTRMLNSDVKYRFVIDMDSLKNA